MLMIVKDVIAQIDYVISNYFTGLNHDDFTIIRKKLLEIENNTNIFNTLLCLEHFVNIKFLSTWFSAKSSNLTLH